MQGERLEIYPFLGSYLLAEAIDRAGADVAFHGHAHRGTEKGVTPGGVRVRNVAKPVIGRPFNVYVIGEEDDRRSNGPNAVDGSSSARMGSPIETRA